MLRQPKEVLFHYMLSKDINELTLAIFCALTQKIKHVLLGMSNQICNLSEMCTAEASAENPQAWIFFSQGI